MVLTLRFSWFCLLALVVYPKCSSYRTIPTFNRVSDSLLSTRIVKFVRLYQSSSGSEADPYGDLFDLEKPLESTILPRVFEENTITQDETSANTTFLASSLFFGTGASGENHRSNKWEHWDEFMEEELGDIDAEIDLNNDEERWIQEMRDLVEQKRGRAIWSERSDKEIQKEVKKSSAYNSLNIPPGVAMVISAVHIEKTHTMSEMRKFDEIAWLEYRKWMLEQKKKSKNADVLSVAKTQLSSSWLSRHPKTTATSSFYMSNSKRNKNRFDFEISSDTRKKNKLVILDEPTTTDILSSIPFLDETNINTNANMKKMDSIDDGPNISTETDSSSVLYTESLLNWEKTKEEISLQGKLRETDGSLKTASALKDSISNKDIYMYYHVDPSSKNQYYVVL